MGKVIASAKLKSCRFIRNVLRFSLFFSLHEENSSGSSKSSCRRDTKSHSLMELPFGHIKHKAKQSRRNEQKTKSQCFEPHKQFAKRKDTQFHHSLTKNDVISLYNNIVVELCECGFCSPLAAASFSLAHFDDHYIFCCVVFSLSLFPWSVTAPEQIRKKRSRATEMSEKICLAVTLK